MKETKEGVIERERERRRKRERKKKPCFPVNRSYPIRSEKFLCDESGSSRSRDVIAVRSPDLFISIGFGVFLPFADVADSSEFLPGGRERPLSSSEG